MNSGSRIYSVLGTAGKLLRRIPGRAWLAAGCLLVAAFWLQQHDARIRRQAELKQVRQQASAQVAALKKQAGQEVHQANVENARAIAKLEARRRQIEQQNRQLAAQLEALRKQAEIQAEQVATLPISEVVTRVAAQLGLKADDLAAVAPSEDATPYAAALFRGRGLRGRDHEGGGHGRGVCARGVSTAKNPRNQSDAMAANAKHGGGGATPTKAVALALTGSGARKAETALVELNACRAESNIKNQQAANCQARAEADDAAILCLKDSVAGLNQALQAKDKILSRQASACKTELRAARGTFFGRLAHVTEHIAIGVAVGVMVGVAIR